MSYRAFEVKAEELILKDGKLKEKLEEADQENSPSDSNQAMNTLVLERTEDVREIQ